MDIFYLNSNTFLQNFSKPQIEKFIEFYGQNFKSEKRRKEHALGRFLVKTTARYFYGLNNTEIGIKKNKPYFINNELNFSISHSKNIVLAGFDKMPLGVDVEEMKQRNIKDILAHMGLNIENVSEELFYRYWTAYEAKIKLQNEVNSVCTLKLLPDFMLSILGNQSFDISKILKIYELKSPNASTNPNELINLKLVKANNKNENTVVIQEISTASLEFFEPLNLNIA